MSLRPKEFVHNARHTRRGDFCHGSTLHLAEERTHPVRAGGAPGTALRGAPDPGSGPGRVLGLFVARVREKGVGPAGTLLVSSGGGSGEPPMVLRSATVPWNGLTGQGRAGPARSPQRQADRPAASGPGETAPAGHRASRGWPCAPATPGSCPTPPIRVSGRGAPSRRTGVVAPITGKVVHLLIDAPRRRFEVL